MANLLAPFGFAPVSVIDGALTSYGQTARLISKSNTTPIFFDDPVVDLASGYITQAVPGTTQIAGIFRGCKYLSSALGYTQWSKYWPGAVIASDSECYIEPMPLNTYLVQANGQLLQSHVGLNANFAIGTGNLLSGLSGAMLDVSTIATTTTLPFRITALWAGAPGVNGADHTTPYDFAIVTYNNQDLKSLTGI